MANRTKLKLLFTETDALIKSGHVILQIFVCEIQSFPWESTQYGILCNGESVSDTDFAKGLSWSHKVCAIRKLIS